MKKCTLLFLFFSLAVSAQESFPYKRPILMLNKTVKVIHNNSSEKLGYHGFYTDPVRLITYKPEKKNSSFTPYQDLISREFNVVAIDSALNWKNLYEHNFKLQDSTGEVIYYHYDKENAYAWDFPFEVKDGLDLPEGFYCDYVEKGKYDYSAKVSEIRLTQSYSEILKRKDTTFHFIFFDNFKVSGVKSVTLLLENNKTITEIVSETQGWTHGNEYKYDFGVSLDEKQFELLKTNKLIAIILQDSVHTFAPGTGERIAGILKCIDDLPILK